MKLLALSGAAFLAAAVLTACTQASVDDVEGRPAPDRTAAAGTDADDADETNDDHDDLHGDEPETMSALGDPNADTDPTIGADGIVLEDEAEDELVNDDLTLNLPELDGDVQDDLAALATGSTQATAAKRVKSPVPGYGVSYRYGVRNRRYAAGYHTGQDHKAPRGKKVVAVRSGKIRWSNGRGGAYGNWIGLDAVNGRTYVYCHLSSRAVGAGRKVKAGQVLGRVGATGNTTGPHLHFEDHPKGPFRYAQVRKPRW